MVLEIEISRLSTCKGSSQIDLPTWGRSGPVRAAGCARISSHIWSHPFYFYSRSLRPCLINRKSMHLLCRALPPPPHSKRSAPPEQRILWSLLRETGPTQFHQQSLSATQPELCTSCLECWGQGSHFLGTSASLECPKRELSAGRVSWGCQNQ